MKVTVIGVSHMVGIGKESKRAYDMCKLFCLSKMESFQNDSMARKVAGFETMEVDLKKEAFAVFANLDFPAQLDLETDMVPRMGKLQTVIVGFKKAA